MTDDIAAALARTLEKLDRARVPYMVVGSVAALIHGRHRATLDVDLVIAPDPRQLNALLAALPEDEFYVSPEAAREALAQGGQFNVIEFGSGVKLDLILRKDRAFSETEFGRRISVEAFGRTVTVATVEDTILAKLEWSRLGGGSDRQVEDAAELAALAGDKLDRAYLATWARALGVGPLWEQIDPVGGANRPD